MPPNVYFLHFFLKIIYICFFCGILNVKKDFLNKGDSIMNIWHDIDTARISATDFTVVVEIPKGCKVKYELDKETGMLQLDRILHTATRYPATYGFIPRTYAEDNDPLDALILCSETILPLTLVRCYPIGVIKMVDGGENDEKIIAIPYADPVYNSYKSIAELPKYIFDEMSHFFTVYKDLEGKKTSIEAVEGADVAVKVVESCISAYNEKFGSK